MIANYANTQESHYVTLTICLVERQAHFLVCSTKDEYKTMEPEKQCEQEEMEEEENTQRKAAENPGRGGQTPATFAVEIPRWREASVRPVNREGEDGDLRMGDEVSIMRTTGLEALQHATTDRSNNSPLINADTTT